MQLSLKDIRNDLIERSLLYLIVFLLPALAGSLYRYFEYGWLPIFNLHLALAGFILVVWALRRRLSARTKAISLILFLLAIVLGARFALGVVYAGVGEITLLVTTMLVIHPRTGLWAMVALFLIDLLVAYLYLTGFWQEQIAVAQLNTRPSSWVVFFATLLLFGVMLWAMLRSALGYLQRSIEQLQEVNAELAHQNRELEQNLDLMPIAMAISEEGRVLFLNQAFTRLFGWNRAEIENLTDWQSRAFGTFFSVHNPCYGWAPELLPSTKAHGVRTAEGETVYISVTVRRRGQQQIVSFENLSLWVEAENRWQQSQEMLSQQNEEFQSLNEELESSYLILQETNLQLLDAKERAEESDELKSAFLANLSHEIRTPMNGIIGFADMVASMPLNTEQYKRYGQIISNSSMQLLNILNDIIDIAKIEAGQVEIAMRECDLFSTLQDVHQLYEPIAQQKGLALILSSPTPAPFRLHTDPTRLRQIVENLVNNALKFTTEGYVEIGYRTVPSGVLVYVRDTGIGIPAEYQAKIFERFRQVETQVSKRAGGTGLGLSIAKAFVEMLGGHIDVQSTPGMGSEFFFSLPSVNDSPGA